VLEIPALKPGAHVDLEVSDGVYDGKYRSRIEEINGDLLTVGAPIDANQVVPLRLNTEVTVVLWDETAAYEIKTRLVKRLSQPILLFVLKYTGSYRRVQRRNYVRVPAFYDVIYRVVNGEELGEDRKATMLDLSGGGMRFQTEEKLEKDTVISADLILPKHQITTRAIVRRVFGIEETGLYSTSVEFIDISERDRDRIIGCVFDIQREMRKKGLV